MAASIIDVSSGSLTNATVGVPSTKQQEADYNLVAKKINSEGGAGCRKIVMSFYDVNPVDAANAQQACLSIACGAALHRARQWSTHRGRRQQLHSAASRPAGIVVL